MLEIDCGTLLGNLLWVNDYELIIFGFHMGTYRWCFWNVIWPSGVPWKKFWSCCPDPIMKQKESVYFSFCSICFPLLFLFSGWYVSSFLHFPFSYPRKRKICFIISKYSYMVSPVVFSWWLKEVLTVLNSLTLSLLCLLHFKLYGYALLLILCVISTGWVLK